jgi:predicted RNase H-like nuclease (RuvC/YqgF family)
MNDIKKQNPKGIPEKRKTISKGYLEQMDDNHFNNYKQEISVLKTIIRFQRKEIEELKIKLESLSNKKKLEADVKSPILDKDEKTFINQINEAAVQNDNKKYNINPVSGGVLTKSLGNNSLKEESNKKDQTLIQYDIVSKVIKSGKGWSIFVLGLKLKNMKRQEALKYEDENIFVEGGNFFNFQL